MPHRYRVRPNPVGSFIGGVIALVLIGFVVHTMPSNPGPAGGGFIALWLLLVMVGAATSFYNAFSDKGVSTGTLEPLDEKDLSPPLRTPPPSPPMTPAARLNQLADLRMKGLITADEYDGRRAEILRQL